MKRIKGFADMSSTVKSLLLVAVLAVQGVSASWVSANFVRKGPVVTADATANNIVGTSALGKVPLNVQQRTSAGVDAFKVYANGQYRFRVDSNGTMALNGSVQFRYDALTGDDNGTAGVPSASAIIATGRTMIGVNVLTGGEPRNVMAPLAATYPTGQLLVILDAPGTAGTNNITVYRQSTDTINGATTKTITANYGGIAMFTTSSTTWHAFALAGP